MSDPSDSHPERRENLNFPLCPARWRHLPASEAHAEAQGQLGVPSVVSLTDCLSASAGPDPPPAGPLQSGREDPAGRGAGELHGPRGLERPGRGPAGSGQRRGGHRVLPDGPGAGGQQPRRALHRHPPRALSRPVPCPSRHAPRPALPVMPRALSGPASPQLRHTAACCARPRKRVRPTAVDSASPPSVTALHVHFCCRSRQPDDRSQTY